MNFEFFGENNDKRTIKLKIVNCPNLIYFEMLTLVN